MKNGNQLTQKAASLFDLWLQHSHGAKWTAGGGAGLKDSRGSGRYCTYAVYAKKPPA
jgi:hypothetical protein